jgi:hypothetical protein
MRFIATVFAMICLSLVASAAEHDHNVTMPKEFDMLKKLVGNWEGKANMHGKDETVTVSYALTSGGTAIEEKMGAGTPHEMVTMYHKSGKSVAVTHYCAMGNQPHMELDKTTDKSISFVVKKPVGLSSMKEDHMHALNVTWTDDDHFAQEWTNHVKGKKGEVAVFNFTRKK